MSTSASVFSSHLNYYSRHSRTIPNYMPDSLYYEIGQPLPFIELEFRCAQHPPVAVESSEMDFDKYEDIVVNEHHNHVIPEVKVDHFDESPPMIPT